MLERIYKQYVKNINKGTEPMEFIKSLDNRIILMAMNERQLKSDNMYKDLYNILDKWYKQDKQ